MKQLKDYLDVGALVERFHALKESNPMAGLPVYQIEYNDFFEVFERTYVYVRLKNHSVHMGDYTTDKERLDEIREDYHDCVTHNLEIRGHEEFRNQGYYWFSLWNDGILDEPDFMALYKENARQVVERCMAVLRRGNGNGLFLDANFWADYALVAFVGLLFCDDGAQRQEAVSLARHLLPQISDNRLKAHVLVHIYYITRERTMRQEADAIIASWGDDIAMKEEDARLRDFFKICLKEPYNPRVRRAM